MSCAYIFFLNVSPFFMTLQVWSLVIKFLLSRNLLQILILVLQEEYFAAPKMAPNSISAVAPMQDEPLVCCL